MLAYVQIWISVSVILIWISQFRFHCLDVLVGFAGVEFIVWISYQDVLMLIARYGFHIWIAHCGFQGLDFLSGCPFRLSKRGNQVDG